jgi:RimJ/RimL family protein N-acetyltransferase
VAAVLILCSERLRLRRFELADAPALSSYRSDPAVARYQGFDAPFPLDAARAFVDGLARADPATPGWFQWAIERLDVPGLIGDVGVHLHEDRRQAAIGYTLAPPFQRQGYASEAIARLLEHLFRDRELRRVSAECDTRNAASVRLLERLGFRREGHLSSSTWSKGEWSDDYQYGMLADEWRRSPGWSKETPRI